MKVTLCMVVLNRLEEVQKNLRATCPYVDRTIIIDGGSTDGTLEWLDSEEARSLNIEFKEVKQVRLQYGNHTPTARNPYLEMCDTSPNNWVLVLDSDEFLEEQALQRLHDIAVHAEHRGINNIGFQAHDIWSYEDGQVYDNKANYWHHSMFFKASPGMHYNGATHAGIVRPQLINKWEANSYEYRHIKSERRMWCSSTYLYWTTARTAQNFTRDKVWLDFHEMMMKYDYLDWHVLNRDMISGTIPDELKEWFITHKDDDNPEARAWFVHYFIFTHPEQNMLSISNRDKTWNYLENCRKRL